MIKTYPKMSQLAETKRALRSAIKTAEKVYTALTKPANAAKKDLKKSAKKDLKGKTYVRPTTSKLKPVTKKKAPPKTPKKTTAVRKVTIKMPKKPAENLEIPRSDHELEDSDMDKAFDE